ncbi:TetR/AcrR family transcriptional regulator [Clostridium sp. Sa3CUN1]|uniref:TetR/AcrR family transcriptional regulator n=1 Tax=Clostridium gallinarum TaxID=2762246 RepID=A0ABR8Q6G7_9CLOT|nr:TetR/AcrR family transcriptional regulator [Clostridium gallinarum]MBD7916027.1 TetR/AcrR family transcriptional regulator [Clostridium gallinarum]
MRELKGIEEKILDRALYLFGKNGTTNVPIRTIVREAGVNVSAINYYFGSKDRMLKYVKEFYLENISQAYAALYNDNLSDEEKVIECTNEIIEYSLRYPGVLIMNKEAMSSKEKDDIDIKIIENLKDKSNKLDGILKKVINSNDDDFIYKKMIFISSITYPTANEELVFENNIINNKEKRIKYIIKLIKMLKEK